MMRIDSFGRGVAFSAIAALGFFPWLIVCGPVVGGWNAQAMYLVAAAVGYLAMLGSRLRPSLIAAAAIAGWAGAVCVDSTSQLAIVLAAVVGTLRSGVIFGPATARSLVVELSLLGGGLVLARSLAFSWLGGPALAVWSFFLLQSVYFLRGDLVARRGGEPAADGFDAAVRRATDLLDRRSPDQLRS